MGRWVLQWSADLNMRTEMTPLKGTSRYEFLSLSPQHQRADYSRKILRINDAIRSILSINHMERMDLIAINNRSLCNHSKVKRAERTIRKPNHSVNLPNLKELRLDNRRRSIIRAIRPHEEMPQDPLRKSTQNQIQAQLCQKYIEEYLQKLKQEQRFDILANRTKLIQEACKEIIGRIDASSSKKKTTSRLPTVQSGEVEVREVKLPMNARKARSITEIEYSEELNRIRRSSEYESKARAINERMFLRKIKQIKLHSQPE